MNLKKGGILLVALLLVILLASAPTLAAKTKKVIAKSSVSKSVAIDSDEIAILQKRKAVSNVHIQEILNERKKIKVTISAQKVQPMSNGCVDLSGLNEYVVTANTVICPGYYEMNDTDTDGAIIFNANNVQLDCNEAIINGSRSGFGIYANGRSGIQVLNCNVRNYKEGIYFDTVTNALISNSNLSNHTKEGVLLLDSNSNTVSNNNISNNAAHSALDISGNGNRFLSNLMTYDTLWAMYTAVGASNANISGNTITNSDSGVWLGESTNSVVENNLIQANTLEGIIIEDNSGHTIKGNTILNSGQNGINIFGTANSNTILNNTILNSGRHGIRIFSGANTIKNNNVSANAITGINASSAGNLIYNNYFSNSLNAYSAVSNKWNTTQTAGTNIIGGPYIGGNFWSDYTGTDLNGDGLGDTQIPYNSTGKISVGGDFLPLVVPGGGGGANTVPTIFLVSPANNTVTSDTTPDHVFYFTDPENSTASCTLYYNGTSKASNSAVLNNTQTTLTASTTSDGIYDWSITCNDGAGSNTSLVYRITIDTTGGGDTTPPGSVTNLRDTQNDTTWILWNWTNPSDSDFSHVEIWINNTFRTNVSADFYNATGLNPDTGYEIQTRTADTNGNVNQTWVNDSAWTKALGPQVNTVPTIFLLAPPNNTLTTDSTPTHQFYYTDPENSTIPSCSLYYNGTFKGGWANVPNNTWMLLDASQTQNGIYDWNIVCNDGVGSNTSETRRILINAVTVPNTRPTIYITAPPNNTVTTNRTLQVDFYFTDPEQIAGTSRLYTNGTLRATNTTTWNNTQTSLTYGNLSDGIWDFWINVSDGGLENKSLVYRITIDGTPPGPVTNLRDIANGTNFIIWTWTNPTDSDFNHVEVWINGTFYANTSFTAHTALGLNPNTGYEIQIRTVDNLGNIGVWTNDTGFTRAIDLTPPKVTFETPTPNNTTIAQNWAYINASLNESGLSATLEWNGVNESMTQGTTDREWFRNKTGLANGNYTFRVYARDLSNNVGATEYRWVFINILDTTPPATVTNLRDTANDTTWILWNWTNPSDLDFNHVEIWINGTFYSNVSTDFINVTGLTPDTGYEIQTRTVDNVGNINTTWVNDTGFTKALPPTPQINTVPTIYILFPPNNTFTSDNTQTIWFLITDNENSTTQATLYFNGTNMSYNGNVQNNTATKFTVGPLANGIWNYYIYAFDGAGSNASLLYNIIIGPSTGGPGGLDIPEIFLVSPADNTTTADNTPEHIFYYLDDLQSTLGCTLFYNPNIIGTNSSTQNNTNTSIIPSSQISDGTYEWRVLCQNSTSSVLSNEFRITITTPSIQQPGGPGGGGGAGGSPGIFITVPSVTLNLTGGLEPKNVTPSEALIGISGPGAVDVRGLLIGGPTGFAILTGNPSLLAAIIGLLLLLALGYLYYRNRKKVEKEVSEAVKPLELPKPPGIPPTVAETPSQAQQKESTATVVATAAVTAIILIMLAFIPLALAQTVNLSESGQQLESVSTPETLTKAVILNITNKGRIPDAYYISLLSGPTWAEVQPSKISLNINETGNITLFLKPPADIRGEYTIRIKAESVNNPEIFTTYDLTVIGPSPLEGGITGMFLLAGSRAGASILGALILFALMFAYWHELPEDRKRETRNRVRKLVGRKPLPVQERRPAPSEVEKVVREVFKGTEIKVPTTLNRREIPKYPAKLVPYEKKPGKLLWEA